MTGFWAAVAKAYLPYVKDRQAEIDAELAAEDAAYEEYAKQRRAEIAAELADAEPGPEPGTTEWHIATGNYIDPEPEWDAGEPYLDHAHGVAYYDTVAAMEAERERWPEYKHVAPEPERPAPAPREVIQPDSDPWACRETEAGLWRRSPWESGTG
jgi:hypothetical protein